jgi:hypothetical protein
MVGIDKVQEYLGEFKTNYVIIGGTALNLNLREFDLVERATQDIDMIMLCESMTSEYLSKFWDLIRAGGYKPSTIKSENGEKLTFYRFVKPTDKSFPSYIELFTRKPEGIILPEDIHLVHIENTEDLSSFSAILLDDDYYNYAKEHATEMHSIQVIDKFALITLKARAYISNLQLKEAGHDIKQHNIDKHKNDVYRISFLIEDNDREDIAESMKNDLREFIRLIRINQIGTRDIAKKLGVAEMSMEEFINKLERTFNL